MELLELLSRKDPARARRRLEKLLPELGADPDDWQYASIIFQRSGDIENALRLQNTAFSRRRSRHDTRVRLAALHSGSGRKLWAQYHLLMLSLKRNLDTASLRTCVDLALQQRRFALAIGFASRWCQLENRGAESLMALARSYFRKGNREKCRSIALEVWQDPTAQKSLGDSLWHELVDYLYDPRAPQVAEAALSTGLRHFPQNGALLDLQRRSTLVRRFAVPAGE
jgi:tetratricopeptide (TPR) repeat protein